jgi:hypothetical protein
MNRLTGKEIYPPFNPTKEEAIEFYLCEGPHERFRVQALTEEEKFTQMNLLVKRLILNIQEKYELIDMRGIDSSAGDLTKVQGYGDITNALRQLSNLSAGKSKMLPEMLRLEENILRRKDLFKKAYVEKNNIGIWLYQCVVMTLFYGTVICISKTVNFYKQKSGLTVEFSEPKSISEQYVMKDVINYNEAFRIGKIDEFLKGGKAGVDANINEDLGVIGIIAASIGAFFMVIFLIRASIAWIYSIRRSLSREFTLVSQFLEINAALMSGDVKKKQEKAAETFIKLADTINIESEKNEKKVEVDIKKDKEEIVKTVKKVGSEKKNVVTSSLI